MSKKLYYRTEQGGVRFTTERMGHVRVPNYVYDVWMPLLGAKAIGVYTTYCRLEREGVCKGLSQNDLAKACRVGFQTLAKINEQLEELGFIKVKTPEKHEILMHWTTEITVLEPPREVPAGVIEDYAHPQGYEPLSTWLVAESDKSGEASVDEGEDEQLVSNNADTSDEYHPSSASNNAKVEALEVETLGVEEDLRANEPSQERTRGAPTREGQSGSAVTDDESTEHFKGLFGEERGDEWHEAHGGKDRPSTNRKGPWLTWHPDRIHPRGGVEAADLQHVGWLVEQITGLVPKSDQLWRRWRPAYEAMFEEASGDFGVIEEAIRAKWPDEERFRTVDPHKYVAAVQKVAADDASSKVIHVSTRSHPQ